VSAYERSSYQHRDRSSDVGEDAPEYQITLDTNVKRFGVSRDKWQKVFDLGQYYGPEAVESIAGYPKEAAVIEYKTPLDRGVKRQRGSTPDSLFFRSALVKKMQIKDYVAPNFEINKGNAATYLDQLAEIVLLRSRNR
jgi:hypothetical protein